MGNFLEWRHTWWTKEFIYLYFSYTLIFCYFRDSISPSYADHFPYKLSKIVAVVQSLNHVALFVTPCDPRHARPPCPSPSPGARSNSWPLSQWCHPAISSSATLLSFCLQSFPASGSLPPSSSHQVAKVLELPFQHQSFQWIFRTDFL